eukprot:1150356-Pelagomonas_calceolata.AAC.3
MPDASNPGGQGGGIQLRRMARAPRAKWRVTPCLQGKLKKLSQAYVTMNPTSPASGLQKRSS